MRIVRNENNKGRPRESFANLYAELGGDRFRKPKTPAKVSRFAEYAAPTAPEKEKKGTGADQDKTAGVELYEKALAFMEKSFGLLGRGKMFDLKEGRKIAGMLVESAAKDDALFLIAVHRQYGERFLQHHSVNTAILAAKLGGGLCLASREREELCLAALLHAVGSIFVPEDIFYKDTPMTDAEKKIMRTIPVFGYKVLKNYSDSFPFLAETALQVHERIDGSGYPAGLKEDEILDYAQIIGLVGMYEALIHDRPHRRRFSHFAAIKEIIRKQKHRFKRHLLKAMIGAFSLFPLYSYVKLNSGAVGRVVGIRPEQPLRPKLKLFLDSRKRSVLTERIVDLQDNPLLYIVDSVGDLDFAD